MFYAISASQNHKVFKGNKTLTPTLSFSHAGMGLRPLGVVMVDVWAARGLSPGPVPTQGIQLSLAGTWTSGHFI